MKIEAAVWDLDGTLVDSLADIAASMNRVLDAQGFATHEIGAYKLFIGDGIEKLVRRALPANHRDEETLGRCLADMRQTYTTHMLDNTKPYPGIPKLLDKLAIRGVAQAILSNKPDTPTQQIVAACLQGHGFKAVQGARPGIPKKPDPTAALALAERIGVQPGECIYLGDTATDMKTAVAANMFPIGVLWGFRGPDELLSGGAKILIKSPRDMVDLLEILG